MTVTELMAVLQTMPPDAEVGMIWDGALRSWVRYVWVTRRGAVALVDAREAVDDEDDRPSDAPSAAEDPHWETPEVPPAAAP